MSKDAAVVEPINNYDAGGSRRARELAKAVPATRPSKVTTGRARIAAAKPSKKDRARALGPTLERMAKGDVIKTTGGTLVSESGLDHLHRNFRPQEPTKAQEILSRLHHRCSLDHDPGMNTRMYDVGKKYEELAQRAGLNGISAQNLLSLGGEGDAAYMMPVSEAAAVARERIRRAWRILTPRVASAMHAILVEGREAEGVGRDISTYRSERECATAALTALRIALWTLVDAKWA